MVCSLRYYRIGFAIAQRLSQEGASVVVSSRKQKNVDSAIQELKSEGLNNITGIVCHVSKAEDRAKLFSAVCKVDFVIFFISKFFLFKGRNDFWRH